MNKRNLLRRLAMLLCLLLWMTSTVNTTFGYIVTATESLINTFVPEKAGEGTFTLEKLVEHPYGEDFVIPESISFTFEISLGASYANTTLSTSAGEITADQDGTLAAVVKPGKTFSVFDLAVGTPVTVTELPTEHKGFAPKDGISTCETVVAEDTETLLQFTNVYTPEPQAPEDVTTQLSILKTVESLGEVEVAPAGFDFLLENLTTGESITLTSDSEGWASQILTFTAADLGNTYSYRLTEVNQGASDITYDTAVYTFTVTVEQGEGNTLTLVPSAELSFSFHNIADRNNIDPGDSSNLFWLITMLLSGTAFVVLFISDRKKRLPL